MSAKVNIPENFWVVESYSGADTTPDSHAQLSALQVSREDRIDPPPTPRVVGTHHS